MKQQTALEWFFDELYSIPAKFEDEKQAGAILEALRAAKEIEKLQITHAHKTASLEAGFEHSADDWAEQYYTNTYGQ